jgi:chromosome segregation ATPase
MRILKVELRNYRGVTERLVEFAPRGVTIVEGPNEIGKSSIPEAIDRLIEYMDSSGAKGIQAVKPVDRDIGPEVMIEAEAGDYAFAYRKRFLRDKITQLDIHRPHPEHHTGREAHDRVQAILAETVDMALWKALRMQQGDVVGQAALTEQTSLSAALDRAAGESTAGDEEMSLFDRTHDEYLQFWTETGRRKAPETEMERTIARQGEEIHRIEEALRAIENDVEASVRLEAEGRRLEASGRDQRARLAEYATRVDALAKVEAGIELVKARFDNAQQAATEAQGAEKARQDAKAATADAKATQEKLAAAVDVQTPKIEAARARVTAAEAAVASANAAREAARKRADESQADLARLRDAADLATLVVRAKRAKAALVVIDVAAADAAIPVDANMLESIRSLHRTVELARARLEATRPLVTVEAIGNLAGEADGRAFQLAAGKRLERRVDRSINVTIPGAASLSVVVGAADDPTAAELETGEARLKDLYRSAGAIDLADAGRLHSRREEAVRAVAEQRRVLRDALGDLTGDALEARIATLQARIKAGKATQATAKSEDEEVARRAADAAQQALGTEEKGSRAAEEERDAARNRLSETDKAHTELAVELRLATEESARREAVLADARSFRSDVALAATRQEKDEAAERLRAQVDEAREQLAREGPDQAREVLENAKQALARVDADTRTVQDQLLEVTTRLRDLGEDGLAEDLQEAEALRDRTAMDLRLYQARAAARRLLYETLKEEREMARKSYVAPLKREIENLGKIVFGADFAVELNDLTLAVTSRTLDGRTISYESLSVGAKEQIALISRLACATIVAPDGGVPVIIDDALGNSDQQRLEAMGAVLAVAGRQSQIIVLTCQPDRYGHVGGATIVRLS